MTMLSICKSQVLRTQSDLHDCIGALEKQLFMHGISINGDVFGYCLCSRTQACLVSLDTCCIGLWTFATTLVVYLTFGFGPCCFWACMFYCCIYSGLGSWILVMHVGYVWGLWPSAVFIQRQKQKTKKFFFFFNTRLVRIFIFIFEIRAFIVVGVKKN